jgi:hypothetical protein
VRSTARTRFPSAAHDANDRAVNPWSLAHDTNGLRSGAGSSVKASGPRAAATCLSANGTTAAHTSAIGACDNRPARRVDFRRVRVPVTIEPARPCGQHARPEGESAGESDYLEQPWPVSDIGAEEGSTGGFAEQDDRTPSRLEDGSYQGLEPAQVILAGRSMTNAVLCATA